MRIEFTSHGALLASGCSILVAMVTMVSSGIPFFLFAFLSMAMSVLHSNPIWQNPVESVQDKYLKSSKIQVKRDEMFRFDME